MTLPPSPDGDLPEDTLRYGEPTTPAATAPADIPVPEDLWSSLKALWTGEAEPAPTLPPDDPVWPLG